MRTKLALLALALSTTAIAEPERSPSDPYVDPQPPAAAPRLPPQLEVSVLGHGPLGIVALEISPELRMHLGAPRDRGMLVDAVLPNTLAARAGLKVGDLVLDIDNAPVGSTSDVIAAIGKRKKGEQVVLDVIRTGIPATLRATLDRDPGVGGDLDRQLRQQLDEMRRRLDEMERRFEPRRDTSPR